ncbi:hypothetical protein [Thiocapsa sp.]
MRQRQLRRHAVRLVAGPEFQRPLLQPVPFWLSDSKVTKTVIAGHVSP